MITKRPSGWIILSPAGKKLGGPYKNHSTAVKREKEVLYSPKKTRYPNRKGRGNKK